MSDPQFRTWARRLITTVASYYILYGGWLLLTRSSCDCVLSLTGGTPMTETTDPLVLDLVEWIAREPRLYSEVIETWRTSCPRLTIWEDAVDRGYVARRAVAGRGSGSRSPRAAKNSCASTAASADSAAAAGRRHHFAAPDAVH